MSKDALNQNGNHQGEFTQTVGGWAEYAVYMTETTDTIRHDVVPPPGKVIPIIFLPGVMGSNLRMTEVRRKQLVRNDNRSWRPDDISKSDVVRETGYGGWFVNATPAQRQLNFDPTETEVEYYHYSESGGRFDPDGAQTKRSDARHRNVPDSLSPIPPLMGHYTSFAPDPGAQALMKRRKFANVAQVARWRGWSEVFFKGPYGMMLRTTELYLNNMVKKGSLTPYWRAPPASSSAGAGSGRSLTEILLGDPKGFGGASGEKIAESDLKKIADCWYPVHAMGYNYLKSNAESAKCLAERLRGLARGYVSRGFKCSELILVTHSMGGLVARALIHPLYGNLLGGDELKVLGVYHNVMPAVGAAAAYKRMRFGFRENRDATISGLIDGFAAGVLGPDGQHSTAILANAPGPLELMPGQAYGQNWLKVVDSRGTLLWSWPRGSRNALQEIYLQPPQAWWRLINPAWVNPGNVSTSRGGGVLQVQSRLITASAFLQSIENTFHPSTYASYCASRTQLSYSEIVFVATSNRSADLDRSNPSATFSSPEKWVLVADDAVGTLTVRDKERMYTLRLQSADAMGDQTVPALRSAKKIRGTLFEHGVSGDGYEHQSSYADSNVLASMLYSIVQIAKTADWGGK